MIKIDGVSVRMATARDDVAANIAKSAKRGLPKVESLPEWRATAQVALVGGGPSLAGQVEALKGFGPDVMACGSVHDHLVSLGVSPRWTVVSDPDPVMAEYLRRPVPGCVYLVASMCDQAVFDALKGCNVVLWHCGGNDMSSDLWGDDEKILIGGGCTVGTRAFMLAMAFGYRDIHLFGFDTCLGEADEHHAYAFATQGEELGEISEVALGSEGGKRFRMAGYHLGQLFDFKSIINEHGKGLRVSVHGGGALGEMLNFAREEPTLGAGNG